MLLSAAQRVSVREGEGEAAQFTCRQRAARKVRAAARGVMRLRPTTEPA
jgi:hypothetical protein